MFSFWDHDLSTWRWLWCLWTCRETPDQQPRLALVFPPYRVVFTTSMDQNTLSYWQVDGWLVVACVGKKCKIKWSICVATRWEFKTKFDPFFFCLLKLSPVLPYSPNSCWCVPAIIWSRPSGGAICRRFQFLPHTHGGVSASKSLIEMDWVIQLTPTHLGVLCVVGAFALGYCHKSLRQHRNSAPVLAVFIKLNWVKLFLIMAPHHHHPVSFFFSFFFIPVHKNKTA